MRRAVVIARVSTEEQAKGTSQQTQIEECLALAHEHGYDVAETDILMEEGVSASTDLDARPISRAAWERLKRGEIASIIYYDLDRAGWTLRTAELIEESMQYGDGILLARKPPLEDPIGQVIALGASALVAKIERYMIRERMMRGRRAKAARGGYAGGGKPFWLLPPDKNHPDWRLDPMWSPVTRQIFDLYLKGHAETGEDMGADRIARYLQEKGTPTPRRGKKWNVGSILYTLHNEAAAGVHRQLTGTKGQMGFDPGEPIQVSVPAIVSREEWEKTQRLLTQRRNYGGGRERRNWLLTGGILRCAQDGYHFLCNGKHGHLRAYYCPGRTRRRHADGSSPCDSKWVNADWIEGELLRRLQTLLESPEHAAEAVRDYLGGLERQRSELLAAVGPVEERLQALRAKRKRILQAHIDGLAEEDYRHQLSEVDQALKREEARASQVESTLRQLRNIETDRSEIQSALESGVLKTHLEITRGQVRETIYSATADGNPVEPEPSRFDGPRHFDDETPRDPPPWIMSWQEDPFDPNFEAPIREDRRFENVRSLRALLRALRVELVAYPDGYIEATGLLPLGRFESINRS